MSSQGYNAPFEADKTYDSGKLPVVEETIGVEDDETFTANPYSSLQDSSYNESNSIPSDKSNRETEDQNRNPIKGILKTRSQSLQNFADTNSEELFNGNRYKRTMSVREVADTKEMKATRSLRSAELRSEMRRSEKLSSSDHGSVASRVKDWEVHRYSLVREYPYSRSKSFREQGLGDDTRSQSSYYREHSKSLGDLSSASPHSPTWFEERGTPEENEVSTGKGRARLFVDKKLLSGVPRIGVVILTYFFCFFAVNLFIQR